MTEISKLYEPVTKGIEILNGNNSINSLVLKSSTGLGKSFFVDKVLDKLKANYIVFKGATSEARFWQFIQENNEQNKIICFRDCGNLLRHITFLDFLKSATDIMPIRKIKRLTYAKHEGVIDEIDFVGKIIFEINDLPKKYKEDLSAVLDRSLYIELSFSFDDIKDIMYQICKDDNEKEVTNYLIEKIPILGFNQFNLRTQRKMLQIYYSSIEKSLNWKEQIDLFIQNNISEARKLLYRASGNNPIQRIEFCKYLMKQGWSYATSERRISEWLFLGEIFSDSKLKQAKLMLNKNE